jgi:hypothetical protein
MLKLTGDHRRALELLADSSNGCAESVMLAFGFTKDVIADLLIARLAESELDRGMKDDGAADLWRVQITDAGRRVLAKA